MKEIQISLYEELKEHNLEYIYVKKSEIMKNLWELYKNNKKTVIIQNMEEKYKIFYKRGNSSTDVMLENAIRIRFEGTCEEYENMRLRIKDEMDQKELVRKSDDFCKLIEVSFNDEFLVMDIYIAV